MNGSIGAGIPHSGRQAGGRGGRWSMVGRGETQLCVSGLWVKVSWTKHNHTGIWSGVTIDFKYHR